MAVNFYIPAGYAGCYDENTLHHCHKELVHTATSTSPSWREISWECLGGVIYNLVLTEMDILINLTLRFLDKVNNF